MERSLLFSSKALDMSPGDGCTIGVKGGIDMKTKAVCVATGLSRKTLLLYEEKGLFAPEKRWSNGREYREYTQADIRRLRQIATLRRAWFTMEEIRQMQEDPAKTETIFLRYYEWLQAQREELDGLLEAAGRIRQGSIPSWEALAGQLERPARALPLPAADAKPRFRYLDELEERPPHVQVQANFASDGGNAGFWQLRRMKKGGLQPVSYDDMIEGIGLRDYAREIENGSVPGRCIRDPRYLEILKGFFDGLIAAVGLVAFICLLCLPRFRNMYGMGRFVLVLAALAGLAGVRGLLELLSVHLENRRWRKTIRKWPARSNRP